MFPPPHFRRSSYLPFQNQPNIPFPPPNNFPTLPPPGSSPSKVDQFLKTTDQLMKTAKTYEPYIQQAKPLLKNLPAMWKLYKGFTSSDSGAPKSRSEPQSYSANRRSSTQQRPSAPIAEQPSLPRIYQPPFE